MALRAGPRILLGIDYGTTFTGLAWVQQADALVANSAEDIIVFYKWPDRTESGTGSAERRELKVPSKISYTETDNNEKQWGYSIDGHSTVLKWTKLELMPQSPATQLNMLRYLAKGLGHFRGFQKPKTLDNETQMHLAMSATDIIEDYLYNVASEWHGHMVGAGSHTLRNIDLDIVVTHPTAWNYEAINATIKAVRGAFHGGRFQNIRDFYIVPEPEACALYTIQDMINKNHDNVFPRECFVLVDAGGGTIDVASYLVTRKDPLELTLIAKDDGADSRCGATFVDAAFLEWLQKKVVGVQLVQDGMTTGGHCVQNPSTELLLQRFNEIKEQFDDISHGTLQLPRRFSNAKGESVPIQVAEGHEDTIVDGVVTITRADLEEMFARSVGGAENLIVRQVEEARREIHHGFRLRVTNILLSGGFAQNPYLRKRVAKYAMRSQIEVHTAEDCWTAVVRGAILKGMGVGSNLATRVEICPRHYGVCLDETYNESNLEHDREVTERSNLTNRDLVRGRIKWMVKKGDVILPDSPIISSVDFESHVSMAQYDRGVKVRVTFVATSLPDPPNNISELRQGGHEVADVMVSMSGIPRKELRWDRKPGSLLGKYLTGSFVAEMEVSTDVKFTVKRGKKIEAVYLTALAFAPGP